MLSFASMIRLALLELAFQERARVSLAWTPHMRAQDMMNAKLKLRSLTLDSLESKLHT